MSMETRVEVRLPQDGHIDISESGFGHIYFNVPTQAEIEKAFYQISDFCRKQIEEKYGNWSVAQQRLDIALEYLKNANTAFYFLMAKEVADLSVEMNHPLASSGSGSILSYLLGFSPVDPLPPHYYCPVCRRVEEANNTNDGFDLPEKNCPACGSDMRRNGHNCPEHLYWVTHWNKKGFHQDLHITKDVLLSIQRRLDSRFCDCETEKGVYHSVGVVVNNNLNAVASCQEATGILANNIPTLDRGVWGNVIRQYLSERKARPIGNESVLFSKEFYETEADKLDFYAVTRLFGLFNGAFTEDKDVARIGDMKYYLLQDEVYEALTTSGAASEQAAYDTSLVAFGAFYKIADIPDAARGNMERIQNLWSRAAVISRLFSAYWRRWYEKYYPTKSN